MHLVSAPHANRVHAARTETAAAADRSRHPTPDAPLTSSSTPNTSSPRSLSLLPYSSSSLMLRFRRVSLAAHDDVAPSRRSRWARTPAMSPRRQRSCIWIWNGKAQRLPTGQSGPITSMFRSSAVSVSKIPCRTSSVSSNRAMCKRQYARCSCATALSKGVSASFSAKSTSCGIQFLVPLLKFHNAAFSNASTRVLERKLGRSC
mmetsp:Transcript_27023/g.58669  ORF Transcript_27023/g.58669 Transcript_27023/m.58669 type:complete len:204 (+) Transcript_27023:364-975(+)